MIILRQRNFSKEDNSAIGLGASAGALGGSLLSLKGSKKATEKIKKAVAKDNETRQKVVNRVEELVRTRKVHPSDMARAIEEKINPRLEHNYKATEKFAKRAAAISAKNTAKKTIAGAAIGTGVGLAAVGAKKAHDKKKK